jgi:hypothetical protein
VPSPSRTACRRQSHASSGPLGFQRGWVSWADHLTHAIGLRPGRTGGRGHEGRSLVRCAWGRVGWWGQMLRDFRTLPLAGRPSALRGWRGALGPRRCGGTPLPRNLAGGALRPPKSSVMVSTDINRRLMAWEAELSTGGELSTICVCGAFTCCFVGPRLDFGGRRPNATQGPLLARALLVGWGGVLTGVTCRPHGEMSGKRVRSGDLRCLWSVLVT